MKIEDQVCTIEQAKKLLSLGVSNGSYFVWGEKDDKTPFCSEGWMFEGNETHFYPAFTVAELGVLLPKGLGGNDGHNWSFYHRHCWKGESVGYSAYGVPSIEQDWYQNEAESRADMLIQLLESGKITPEQCNESLK